MLERPTAKTNGIISEQVDGDLVLYDEGTQTAHSLSGVAASVWALCDGELSAEDIAVHAGLEPALVVSAIEELQGSGLIERSALLSRREAGKRAAKIGAAAFAAPMIYSVAVGPAMAAASVCTANVNGARMPSTATCSATADDSFGNSTGPGHCCNGKCYFDETNDGTYCPAPTCTQGDTTHVTSASQCCTGTAVQCDGNHLCCT